MTTLSLSLSLMHFFLHTHAPSHSQTHLHTLNTCPRACTLARGSLSLPLFHCSHSFSRSHYCLKFTHTIVLLTHTLTFAFIESRLFTFSLLTLSHSPILTHLLALQHTAHFLAYGNVWECCVFSSEKGRESEIVREFASIRVKDR